ncbi:MAG: ketoacyl-ACP synthase III [Bacteriovoracaceae bacterium]|nr:ketoacyl-ACP synthase III [Bacteriovoracaceae bacterium]
MAKVKIIGTGSYVPGEPISNDQLLKLANIEFDTSKLENKLGIKYRHIAKLREIEESTADFAVNSVLNAISDAGIHNDDVGLFVVGTDTPEYISPATALIVQGRIQKKETFSASFDVGATCASFTSAFNVAAKMLAGDSTIKYAAVTGVYNMPAYVKDGDVFGYSIFADGAGTIILERTDDNDSSGYIDGQFMTDGTQWDYVGVYAGGTKKPITKDLLDNGDYGLQNLQRLPGDRNVRLWPMMMNKLLDKVGMKKSEIDHIIFTQINRSVIEEVMKVIELPMTKTTCVMDKYGYTGSGCIPMAFENAVKNEKIKRGDKVMFIASGAGFAVSANIFTY